MSDSDSDVEFVQVTHKKHPPPRKATKRTRKKAPPKKRRGIDPPAAPPSPTYSNKIPDSDEVKSDVETASGMANKMSDSDSDVEFVPVAQKKRSPQKKRTPKKAPPKKRRGIDPPAAPPSPTNSDKMPDSDEVKSDSDVEKAPVIAPNKRRMIDPSAIAPVPIYSNKVFSFLNTNKMPAATLIKTDTTAKSKEDVVLSEPTAQLDSSSTDSEDEEAPQKVTVQPPKVLDTVIRSPSPPPPLGSPSTRSTRASRRTFNEMNRKLSVLGSCLRTSPLKRARGCRSSPSKPTAVCVPLDDEDGNREITLKFRWRSVLHKITVPSSAPLSKAVEELSVKIKVTPSRILLLNKERDLPTDSSANELGLSIADIIDCVIMEEENKEVDENEDGIISIRIQNKERSGAQTYSLHRDAALGSVLCQYISSTYTNTKAQPKVVFCFDGTKIKHSQTPSQLDMEDGDVIDVWA